VTRSLVQLFVDGEPFAQAYTGDGPITIQATDTGVLRVQVVAGQFEQSFSVDHELTPIDVVVPDSRTVETTQSRSLRNTAGKFRKIVRGGAITIGVVVAGMFLFRYVTGLINGHHKIGKDYIGYVTPEPHDKSIAIVFIHGIFGNNKDTWSGGRVDFTQLLANDPDVKDRADIYEFGYYSPYTGEAQTITQTSVQLAQYLHHDDVFENHQKVVFVAHSMGGLILRKYLLDNREQIQDKVAMMFFYATPTDGSELATIAQKFSNDPQIRGLVPLDADEALQSIQSGWFGAKTLSKKPSYCAYEILKTDNVAIVVSQASASALCTEQPEPITADHIGIVKLDSRRDESYIVLIDALKETVLTTPSASILPQQPPAQGAAPAIATRPKPTAKAPAAPGPSPLDDTQKRTQTENAAVIKFIGDNCTRDIFIDQGSWTNRKDAYQQLSSVKQSSEILGNSLAPNSSDREPLHSLSVTLTHARGNAQLFPDGSNSASVELTRESVSAVCLVRSEVGRAISALEVDSKLGNSCSKEMACDTTSVLHDWDLAHKALPAAQPSAGTVLVNSLRKKDAGRVGLERVHYWHLWMEQLPPEWKGKIVKVDYNFAPGYVEPVHALADPSIGYARWKAYPCPATTAASLDAKLHDGSTVHADFNLCGLPDGTPPNR
jgi:pimeloyl-ACP methyl ester carboxylesterase